MQDGEEALSLLAGRGLAGRDGFLEALALGADAVVEMDADLSHDPAEIPRLLRALSEVDVVIGSRLIPGGQELGRRPWWRLDLRFRVMVARGRPRWE